MPHDLIVIGLRKNYGPLTAVDGVSFSVPQGEIFGLLGKNGAGKTTTIECIVGLRRPDAGSIQLCQSDALANPDAAKQHIGVQLQATALQDKITPREALTLFASFYHRSANVDALLERFSLTEKADQHYDTLSGGQRQRLALALAFVNQPRVIFLDEPTSGLDAQTRRQLHDDIRRLRDDGATVILTTHYIEEAHALCDRIAIMNNGKIVADAPPDRLIAQASTHSRIDVTTALPLARQWLDQLPGVLEIQPRGESWRLITTHVAQTVSELVRKLEADKNELIDLHVHRPSLEDAFIELTGGDD